MLTSLSSSCYNLNIHFCRQKYLIKLPSYSYQVSCRSSFHDEGRQASMVDKNLGVLRERVEKMKLESDQMKQREISQKDDANDARWAYRYGYVYKHKKHESMALMQSFRILLPIYGGLGLALLAGLAYAFFLSIFSHLNNVTN